MRNTDPKCVKVVYVMSHLLKMKIVIDKNIRTPLDKYEGKALHWILLVHEAFHISKNAWHAFNWSDQSDKSTYCSKTN